METSTIKYADICAGIGGFRIGLSKIKNVKCAWSCEINDKCEETYLLNYGEKFTYKDIFSICPDHTPDIDLLCAGFPCQPFSIAGKQLGINDARGTIIFKLLEIIRIKQPKAVLLENVPNILHHNKGNTIKMIASGFEKIHYSLFYKILNSKNFGVPQSRPRVYFVAFRKDINSNGFRFPIGSSILVPVNSIIKEADHSASISKRWEEYIDLYEGRKTLEEMSFAPPKTRQKLERINKNTDLNDCIFQIRSSGIRAVSINEPFPTFAVSISGGGAMIPVLSKQRRPLCLDEIKGIMGFPKTFSFDVSKTDAIKQLANAVCPPVIEEIGKSILEVI